MIIECPECQTRFRMADEKVKPEGTKVRCSRCRHIFAVTPEEPAVAAPPVPEPPPQTEPAQESFAAPAGAGGQETGELSLDFDSAPAPAAAPQEEFSVDAGPETQGSADQGGDPFGGQPDEEFGLAKEEPAGFSFDEPEGAGDFADVGSAENDAVSFGSPDETDPAEFSFDQPGEDTTTFDQPVDDAPVEFSFDTDLPAADDSAGFSFEDSSSEFPQEADPFSFAEEEPASGLESGGETFSFDETSPPSGGDAEDFDFSSMSFGEDEPATEQPPLETTEFRLGTPPVEPRPEMTASPEMEEPPAVRTAVARRKQRSPVGGVLVFVFLLLLGLGGAAGYLFWKDGKLPDVSQLLGRLTGQPVAVAPAGQIRVGELNGYFVVNREAGQLFVIQGNAVNEFSEARSAIAVKGVLYNQEGKAVLQQTVFPGNRLNDETLQTLPFTKIEESMNNQFGDSLSNLNVAPGKAIPFSIVFRNLPSDLAEFTVEVTDSRPGSK